MEMLSVHLVTVSQNSLLYIVPIRVSQKKNLYEI